MRLNDKIKLFGFLCSCVLVLIQFQNASAGFLHDDPEEDFHTLLRSGSNTPIYSVYSKHLSQPYFYNPPSTTPAPKPRGVPLSVYRSNNNGNPVVQYVLLQSNDYVRNLPFLPDTESKPPKRKNKKNKKTKPMEEQETDSKEKGESEELPEESDDNENENGASVESKSEETSSTATESKSPRRKNSRKTTSSRLTTRNGSGAKNSDNKPKTPKQVSQSKPRSQSKQSSQSKPRNSRLRKNRKMNSAGSAGARKSSETKGDINNPSETMSLLKVAETENVEEFSPESTTPEESSSDMNKEIMDAIEDFSSQVSNNNNAFPTAAERSQFSSQVSNNNNAVPTAAEGSQLPTRESIDEAIKILSRVANQISQFNTSPGTLGASAGAQRFPSTDFNNNMFPGNNNGGRNANVNSQQYGAPIDIQRANSIFTNNGEGEGSSNNVIPSQSQYGAPQDTTFRNMFQQPQTQPQQFVRNTNREAYGPPEQQVTQPQRAESSESDMDTASTKNLAYSQGLRNIRSDNGQPTFEIIKTVSKMY